MKIQEKALAEFEKFKALLEENKIAVNIFDDTPSPGTPDSIFPNNWFSVHESGIMILYPLLAANRRPERRKDIIDFLKKKCMINKLVDLSDSEKKQAFLEGTGSLVFDHRNKTGYACLSSRTDRGLAEKVCSILKYKPVVFSASDERGNEIYHTNVIMSIGRGFAVVCLESIVKNSDRTEIVAGLERSELEIIDISLPQMHSFCGNVLELQNKDGKNFLVMSEKAYRSFQRDQLNSLNRYAEIIFSPLETIESVGGGSARCMMAEIG